MLLSSAPFSIEMTDVTENMQLKLIKLQCDDDLRSKVSLKPRTEFWRSLSAASLSLFFVPEALRVATLVGSSYSYEQFFST